jgi:hypothetical protein
MTKFTGQCLCGDVKFEADGEPAVMAQCHCTDCQISSGSGYASLAFMAKQDVKITGRTGTFEHSVDNGNVLTKHFCARCGSQMFGENSARPTMIGLRAGTINEQESFKPQFNLFTSSKMDATQLDPDIPAFEKMPG